MVTIEIGEPALVPAVAVLRGTCGTGPACQGLIDEVVHLIGPLDAQHQDHLRARGASSVTLGVDASDPAPFNLYNSVGFQVVSSQDAWDLALPPANT